MLNIAIRAARLAGTIITRAIPRVDTLKFDKKADLDYVSEIDTQSEKVIIETLLEARSRNTGRRIRRYGRF